MNQENLNNNYSGPERRRYPRLKAALIEYSLLGDVSSKELSFTKNVSIGGVCILLPEEIPTNTLLSLNIYLPNCDKPIILKGKVVWIERSDYYTPGRTYYNVGIEFIDIDEKTQSLINSYISNPLE